MQLKRNDYKEIIRDVVGVLPYWNEATAIAGVPDEVTEKIAKKFRVI